MTGSNVEMGLRVGEGAGLGKGWEEEFASVRG